MRRRRAHKDVNAVWNSCQAHMSYMRTEALHPRLVVQLQAAVTVLHEILEPISDSDLKVMVVPLQALTGREKTIRGR